MPKVGMEPKRRAALVNAVIDEIGEARSLDVTVAQIARRAGMSSGLAHHYFGSKEQMLIAAMRHILSTLSARLVVFLKSANSPRERLAAIIQANFDDAVFDPSKTSAWLSFYVLANSNPDAARLMQVYQRRLTSNLLHELRQLTTSPEEVATTLSALIDGVYLRAALSGEGPSRAAQHTALGAMEALLASPWNRVS